jgi:hypothetical protein
MDGAACEHGEGLKRQRQLAGRAGDETGPSRSTVDANRPYAAIYARRELLTGRALQSMRTFYRSLDDLEAAGLINRPPQKRHGDAGLFGRAYLHLTTNCSDWSRRPPRPLNPPTRPQLPKSHATKIRFRWTIGLPGWQTALYIRIFTLLLKRDNRASSLPTSSVCGPWVFMTS